MFGRRQAAVSLKLRSEERNDRGLCSLIIRSLRMLLRSSDKTFGQASSGWL